MVPIPVNMSRAVSISQNDREVGKAMAQLSTIMSHAGFLNSVSTVHSIFVQEQRWHSELCKMAGRPSGPVYDSPMRAVTSILGKLVKEYNVPEGQAEVWAIEYAKSQGRTSTEDLENVRSLLKSSILRI